MSDINNFKVELKELLERYNASISFSVGEGSDTHGLYDEKMILTVNEDSKEEEAEHINGWDVSAHEL